MEWSSKHREGNKSREFRWEITGVGNVREKGWGCIVIEIGVKRETVELQHCLFGKMKGGGWKRMEKGRLDERIREEGRRSSCRRGGGMGGRVG
jgi:hypothetical protein